MQPLHRHELLMHQEKKEIPKNKPTAESSHVDFS